MASEDGSALPLAAAFGGVIGNYALERELGRGGMGVVYAAVDQTLGKRVALKVLLPAVSQRDDLVQRFFNEARAASTIRHPGIVEVFHYGANGDGTAYIVMEYLEGTSLAARLKSHGMLSIPSAIAIARQTALALAAAHRAGIVHRDLKPDNIFLVSDSEVSGGERVKLLDFGVAKLVDQVSSQPVQTMTGAILGTPQYMSPEQCEGARVVDHRSDLYSLGCTLFQMVTGRLPFIAGGMGGMIGAHLYEQPPHARDHNPLVSEALDGLIDRLLAKSPDARFRSGDEVATALSDPATGASTQHRSVPEAPVPTVFPDAPVERNTPTKLGTIAATTAATRPEVRWWVPLIALLIAGGAAATAFFVIKRDSNQSAATKLSDDERRERDPKHKPTSDDEARLGMLRSAAITRDWDKILTLIETLDRSADPKIRAEVETIRAQLHAPAIQRAATGIKKMRDNGECKKATEQVALTSKRWGADPLLDEAAANCTPVAVALGQDSVAPTPPAPVATTLTPPSSKRDPKVTEILGDYGAQRYNATIIRCLRSGPGVPLPQECMIATCKANERLEIAATLMLRISLAGHAVDRGLDECKRIGYDVLAYLDKDDNRSRLLARLRSAAEIRKFQQTRQQRVENGTLGVFSKSGKKQN